MKSHKQCSIAVPYPASEDNGKAYKEVIGEVRTKYTETPPQSPSNTSSTANTTLITSTHSPHTDAQEFICQDFLVFLLTFLDSYF